MDELLIREYLMMACGNPGAITVIMNIFKEYPNKSFELLDKMKEQRLYDYHIWVKFKEFNKDIHKFVEHLQ